MPHASEEDNGKPDKRDREALASWYRRKNEAQARAESLKCAASTDANDVGSTGVSAAPSLKPEDRDASAISGYAPYPCSAKNCMVFAQGWSFVCKVIERSTVLSPREQLDAIELFRKHGVHGAFSVRRELINFKK